jgi:DNA-binding transcriptional regulator YiaG
MGKVSVIPAQIRALRRRLGDSPEAFVVRFGYMPSNGRITVWRWETGRTKPSPQTIMLMKAILD